MPIIAMLNNDAETFPEGAVCYFEYARPNKDGKRYPVVLVNTHVGLCLRDREMNGYDDSDFYMLVWDEEKQAPREICFALTRGWSYPCYGSSVDATPEVRAKYEAWQAAERVTAEKARRSGQAREIQELRAGIRTAAAAHGIRYARLLKLRKLMSATEFNGLLYILNGSIRSNFKKSMRDQVVGWFHDPAPKYRLPLSPKQLCCIARG